MSYGTEQYGSDPYGGITQYTIALAETTISVSDSTTISGGGLTPVPEPFVPPPSPLQLPSAPTHAGTPISHTLRILPLIRKAGG